MQWSVQYFYWFDDTCQPSARNWFDVGFSCFPARCAVCFVVAIFTYKPKSAQCFVLMVLLQARDLERVGCILQRRTQFVGGSPLPMRAIIRLYTFNTIRNAIRIGRHARFHAHLLWIPRILHYTANATHKIVPIIFFCSYGWFD